MPSLFCFDIKCFCQVALAYIQVSYLHFLDSQIYLSYVTDNTKVNIYVILCITVAFSTRTIFIIFEGRKKREKLISMASCEIELYSNLFYN